MQLGQIYRAIVCLGLALSAASVVRAQEPAPTRADLNGEWVGPLELEGGTHNLSLLFQLTDSAFAGVVYDNGRRFGDMERGTFSGDTVQFHLDALVFTGVIAGNKMKVALIVYNGSTRNFVVTKKPADKGGSDARGG